MNLQGFKDSLSGKIPPGSLSPFLIALWYDAAGDWPAAHGMVDGLGGPEAALVHAYLHRKEGDNGNAGYWYRKAGMEPVNASLEEEWLMLVNRFLKSNDI